MSDLEVAFKALSGKQAAHTEFWRYYDGDQPLIYTSRRLEEVFRNLDARMVENWCAVVVDTVNERVNLRQFTVEGNEAAQTRMGELWEDLRLDLESDETHLDALVTGESFVIAWPDAEGRPRAYYNDACLCHVQYDAEDPHRVVWAAKWWNLPDGKGRRLTLYYPDRLEYYVSPKAPTSVKAFQPLPDTPTAENPFGIVPVFHFRVQRRTTKSDLANVVPIQNGINKLLVDMMVAAEYSAFKQRYVISNAEVQGKLKNAPNEIWDLPAGDGIGQPTQVGEFGANDLANYTNAIDRLALAVSAITRTPKHYFLAQGGDPSGEALMAMEAPLAKKAQDRIDRFVPVWREVAAFLLRLDGLEVPARAITPVFDDPRTVQPLTQATRRKTEVDSGIPLVTLLRAEGWSEEKLAQMATDKQAEQAAQQATLAAGLLEARRRFDAGAGA